MYSTNPDLDKALSSITGSNRALETLARLHEQALAEPPFVSTDARASETETREEALRRHTRELFVALDPDKAALAYLLVRGSGARCVVEAGTSFGVSTIWLALAVGQNAGDDVGVAKVIATENEPEKAARARENWAAAGEDVARWIELREGDILETLKEGLPRVDLLLLDIWTPLALPTLKLVQPMMKKGAMVIVDNIEDAKSGYRDLLEYVDQPDSGFNMTVLPYNGGLGLLVYTGSK
ncbi:hypothetical protein MCOR27_001782 [Pyricularia oryzae]|uniref:O-methyltransferase n=2 Tax=Pyricularia TaxID=48558 RepID=A0ABQ8NDW2_PYRGI|nr:hypothetical protein MCOR01_008117 [Pyricularia oryzae]KAI6295456.1 hypothetical protein MCOR33_007668 [Pyricularia grisea]KAH9433204.1 hypothetical protein MCOR02_005260 [Pyricularia oryzae]KAI6256767.1 hypothetical protein MCOR19_006770 [Pyricularia oryzae]KAI6286454.1 hypothetical protein MCOR27_001782 [Pyricularia oryzae]